MARARKGHGVFRDNRVHVLAEKCSTCIFRPGNLMRLEEGRVKEMVDRCLSDKDGAANIPCHSTLSGDQAICRGFWDGYHERQQLLTVAVRLGIIQEVELDGS